MGRWALSPRNAVVLPVILHSTPERPPVFKRACPAGVEGVLPQQIDVVPGHGREVGEVLVRELLARGAQRGDRVLQVRGGPRANRRDQQVETTCPMHLVLEGPLAKLAPLADEEGTGDAVDRLAVVEPPLL